jgi:hypothetical protein
MEDQMPATKKHAIPWHPGLCRDCGVREVIEGEKRCAACKAKARAHERHQHERRMAKRRKAAGYFEVECGELYEIVTDCETTEAAILMALEVSKAEKLGALLRIRHRPGGKWQYIDPMAIAGLDATRS